MVGASRIDTQKCGEIALIWNLLRLVAVVAILNVYTLWQEKSNQALISLD